MTLDESSLHVQVLSEVRQILISWFTSGRETTTLCISTVWKWYDFIANFVILVGCQWLFVKKMCDFAKKNSIIVITWEHRPNPSFRDIDERQSSLYCWCHQLEPFWKCHMMEPNSIRRCTWIIMFIPLTLQYIF